MSDVETTYGKRLLARVAGICRLALVAAAVLAVAPARPAGAGNGDCFEWLRAEPEVRAGQRVAWDTRRNVLVMFGGASEVRRTAPGDTWEWNGRRWRQAADAGPPPRTGSDMVYDERRGVVVLFGGLDENGGLLRDTWEWDGISWTRREVEGPAPRWRIALAYDSDRGVTVLAGGLSEAAGYYDTWEWDGLAWTLREAGQSPSAWYSNMVYDRKRRTMVYFAGETGELWEWAGEVWTRRDAPGPARRHAPSFAYDSRRGVSVLVGGADGQRRLDDVWDWDGERWTEHQTPLPNARVSADMTYDPAGGRLVLMGGEADLHDYLRQFTSDIWEYSNGTWQRVRGSAPPPHDDPHLVYDTAHGLTVLMGDLAGRYVWEWTGRQWRVRQAANPRFQFVRQAAYDPELEETIVIAFQYPIQLWTWRRPYWRAYTIRNAPSIGGGGLLAFDEGRSVAVIVGSDGQTWEWSDRQDRLDLRSYEGPGGSSAMTYDSARGVCVLRSGRQPNAGQTWEWDGQSWKVVSSEGPGNVSSHAMTYDTRRGRTVMFGGLGYGAPSNEVWRWNGEHWLKLETTGTSSPSPRQSPGFVYDRQRDVFVAFGGQVQGSRDDGETWELRPVVCCDDVETLTTKCKKSAMVAILHLVTDRHDGTRVTLIADGHWRDATVHGDRARVRFPRLTGPLDIEMETPSGCGLRWEAECE